MLSNAARLSFVRLGCRASPLAFIIGAQVFVEKDDNLSPAHHLTHDVLLKNAAASNVDSVSSVISQTTIALVDAYKEYAQAIFHLVSLLHEHLAVLAYSAVENALWQDIIAIRVEVKEKKAKVLDLEVMMEAVTGLAQSAIEVAYQAGADTSAIMIAERLQSAQLKLSQAKSASTQAEILLHKTHALSIEAESEHDDKKTERSAGKTR